MTVRTSFPSLTKTHQNIMMRGNLKYLPMPITEPYSDFLSSSAFTETGQSAKMAITAMKANESVDTSERAREIEGRDGRW